jgi:hypothetical protein
MTLKKNLDENFMMGIFSKYVEELPPLKEYWTHLFEKKQMVLVAAESGAKVLQFAELRKELFHQSDTTNIATDSCGAQLAGISAKTIIDELHDEKKATWKYLSILGSPISFQGCTDEIKSALYGLDATNDRKESALGGTTHQLQQYGCIGISNAAAVSDAKTNGYFDQFTIKGNKSKGMFYQFHPNLRDCLLMVAIEDAPVTTSANREALDKQQEAKRKKEEIIERKSLQKAQEGLVELSYYWEMCNSNVCWRGNPNIVQKMWAWLKSDTAKLEALKENIRMRVVGFVWKQFAVSWSHKGI